MNHYILFPLHPPLRNVDLHFGINLKWRETLEMGIGESLIVSQLLKRRSLKWQYNPHMNIAWILWQAGGDASRSRSWHITIIHAHMCLYVSACFYMLLCVSVCLYLLLLGCFAGVMRKRGAMPPDHVLVTSPCPHVHDRVVVPGHRGLLFRRWS